MCVSMVGEEDGESSRRGYQDVLVGECGLVKKEKALGKGGKLIYMDNKWGGVPVGV